VEDDIQEGAVHPQCAIVINEAQFSELIHEETDAGACGAQVESVLQSTGKPELQPGEMKKDADRLKSDAKSGQSPQQITDAALTEVQQKLASLDRDAAISVMVNKLGMSDAQARQLVQTTIGIAGPLKQKAQEVKQQSVEMGTSAINRVGTISIWLFALALVTLGLSAAGGMVGTAEEGAIDSMGPRTRQSCGRVCHGRQRFESCQTMIWQSDCAIALSGLIDKVELECERGGLRERRRPSYSFFAQRSRT
jgi:hypothetical protein